MTQRPIIETFATPWRSLRGDASGAWLLHPADLHALDPVVWVDHFRMSTPTFPPHPHALRFADEGDGVRLEAGAAGVHLAFIAGTPLGEPIVPKGPFIANTAAAATEMIRRYQSGQMGALAPTPGAFD